MSIKVQEYVVTIQSSTKLIKSNLYKVNNIDNTSIYYYKFTFVIKLLQFKSNA